MFQLLTIQAGRLQVDGLEQRLRARLITIIAHGGINLRIRTTIVRAITLVQHLADHPGKATRATHGEILIQVVVRAQEAMTPVEAAQVVPQAVAAAGPAVQVPDPHVAVTKQQYNFKMK